MALLGQDWIRTQKSSYVRTVFAAIVCCYGVGINWGLPTEFPAAPDSEVPYSPLAFVAQYFRADVAQKYPAVHQLLTLPVYAVNYLFLALTGNVGWPSSTR